MEMFSLRELELIRKGLLAKIREEQNLAKCEEYSELYDKIIEIIQEKEEKMLDIED